MRKLAGFLRGFGFFLLAAALALTVWNIRTDNQVGADAQAVLEELTVPAEQDSPAGGTTEPEMLIPDYKLNPDMDMPVRIVDGKEYVGVISLQELSLELPVMADWNYSKLKQAPCLYSGSAYLDNLVIMAHNYRSQFGRIRRLNVGSRITFTDVDGNAFDYQVATIEILDPYDVENVKNSDWDLTLFTCTLGGQERIAVRCERE